MLNRNMIKEFRGEYRWLSNFAPVHIWFNNLIFPSVENAYMSAKCNDEEWKILCRTAPPSTVKKLSRNVVLVPNWDSIKIEVMKECCIAKYNIEPYKSMLLATGNTYIQEGNTWGDTFWGVDLKTGKGKNNLGKIIMNIRNLLLKK